MNMDTLFYEGSRKRISRAGKDDLLVLQFKDAETEFDGEKRSKFKNKCVLKTKITKTLFEYLEGYNVPNHYHTCLGTDSIEVFKLDMLPVKVMIRNVAAGSLCRRFAVEEGTMLKYPILEYYLQNDELEQQLISESHAYAFGYAQPEEMKHISRLASKVNAVLKSYFERRHVKLIDFQLQFGRCNNKIMVGDEISPDNFRIWEIKNGTNAFNKQTFSFKDEKAKKSYDELLIRLIGKA
ncbi:MAG: phosphoribosylaminoimidazolesuccinocarboxamide synthase [Caldithrix sp.]|nr:phosphoribosylaminoimidazolesuccinocarboxamide synthase [Caldithrix sp.]